MVLQSGCKSCPSLSSTCLSLESRVVLLLGTVCSQHLFSWCYCLVLPLIGMSDNSMLRVFIIVAGYV